MESSLEGPLAAEFDSLVRGEHTNPHSFLGLHPTGEGGSVIRLFRPGASELHLEVRGEPVQAEQVHPDGLFEVVLSEQIEPTDYLIYHTNGLFGCDPYAFSATMGEVDIYLFNKGVHYQVFDVLGAQVRNHESIDGVSFAVWAPSARSVSLVADFNFWDGRINPMRALGESGIFEIFIPDLGEDERYKFEIRTRDGHTLLKADPHSFHNEERPLNASVVAKTNRHIWKDREWMDRRENEKDDPKPLNIYELHLGSWKNPHGHFLNYRSIAVQLAAYCKEMGYTHVELLPITEHPLDESWGYQVSGFYAVTSRYGSPEDFQWFVDYFHQQGLGVILDWVPAHFPSDGHSLARFDGTALYEHEDPRQGYHPHWNTLIFNYGRHEVANFLIGSALFWIEKMHLDGLRVDAVASMLYLDYGREEGNWVPNESGGRENLEAINFLKHLNSIVHERFPGVLMIAEESSAFPGVTQSVDWDGLGFDRKWNMGWMHDTLNYFQKDPLFRHYHHNNLTFGLLYAFSESYVLPLSHDEVVHGKRSLVSKMPGDYWQKFANVRLLMTYQITQPGAKLLFMGSEIGQWGEWNVKEEMHWHLLQYPFHRQLQECIKEINYLYLRHRAFWERDKSFTGFEWVDFSDTDNSIISYLRKSDYEQMLCIHNFTPAYHESYTIPFRTKKALKEIFNSDAERFGGSGKSAGELVLDEKGLTLSIAPLSTTIIQVGSPDDWPY